MKLIQLFARLIVGASIVTCTGISAQQAITTSHVVMPKPGGSTIVVKENWSIQNVDGDLLFYFTDPNVVLEPGTPPPTLKPRLRLPKGSPNVVVRGVVFGDGSTQSTAQVRGPQGLQGLKGNTGDRGAPGAPGAPGPTKTFCISGAGSCGIATTLSCGKFVTSETGSCSETGPVGNPIKACVCRG